MGIDAGVWRRIKGSDSIDNDCDKNDLATGISLGAALLVIEAQPHWRSSRERRFIQANETAKQGRRRRQKLALITLVTLTILATGVAVYAFLLKREPDILHIDAEQQRQVALTHQLAAQTLSYADEQPDLALLLSLEANRRCIPFAPKSA
jgi:hypothetical protein